MNSDWRFSLNSVLAISAVKNWANKESESDDNNESDYGFLQNPFALSLSLSLSLSLYVSLFLSASCPPLVASEP